jgi:putative transposase
MSTGAKVALVEQARREFGVTAALRALSLSRSTWYYQSQRISYEAKHTILRRPLLAIAEECPEYGYRRATTELTERLGEPVNRKVVQKLQRALGLTVLRGKEAPPPSGIRRVITEAGGLANLVARLDEIDPFEVLYTDFTELVYARGKAWLMPIVDDVTKVVPGWALSETNDTDLALKAWRNAKRALARLGVSLEGCIVHHDRDSVFTSYRWVRQLLLRDGVRISYALHGAKDNPEMESFNSRFKNENRSLFADAESVQELRSLVRERMRHYNRRRRHSALGNVAPINYVRSLTRKG